MKPQSDPDMHPALVECLQAGLLCNDSSLINKGEQWGIEGDPTEVALITAAAKAGTYTGSAGAGPATYRYVAV